MTQARQRMARVAARSCSLPRDAREGLELIMDALVPPCFLRLVRARAARFRRSGPSGGEVRQRVALNAGKAATTTLGRALLCRRFDMRKACQHESYWSVS